MLTIECNFPPSTQWLSIMPSLSHHRINNPAYYAWHHSGQINMKAYYFNGILHRNSVMGPAFVSHWKNGQVMCMKYAEHGLMSRDPSAGPAFELHTDNGEKTDTKYYHEGYEVKAPIFPKRRDHN